MLIHIGKCGGSNIFTKFINFHNLKIKRVHGQKPKREDVKKADHICILLRDPITRFISIYYFYYNLYVLFVNKVNDEVKNKNIDLIKNCRKLFETFPTAESCANALNSENIKKKNIAHSAFELLPHLVFNYNVHLSNIIDLIRKKEKIFIIRQEFYEEDFKVYYKYLCDTNNLKENKLELFLKNRRNNTDKYNHIKFLSNNSIQNLKNKMNNDYSILNKLVNYGIIDKTYINTFK